MTETTTTSPASPSPMEDDLADLPGFAPGPTSTPDLLDPSTTTIGTDDLDDWGDDASRDLPPVSATAPRTGSSKASTDWRDLVPLTSTLVAMTSLLVRWIRSRRRQLADGVWIADEEDAEAIAAPLARIAARRSPISGEGSADMIDGLEVMVGATGYAMKNLEREAEGAAYLDTIPDQPAT